MARSPDPKTTFLRNLHAERLASQVMAHGGVAFAILHPGEPPTGTSVRLTATPKVKALPDDQRQLFDAGSGSAIWIRGRLNALFEITASLDDRRGLGQYVYETLAAVLPGTGKLKDLLFILTDEPGEPTLLFEEGIPAPTRRRVTNTLVDLLLEDPDALADFEDRTPQGDPSFPGVRFGLRGGRPFTEPIEVPTGKVESGELLAADLGTGDDERVPDPDEDLESEHDPYEAFDWYGYYHDDDFDADR